MTNMMTTDNKDNDTDNAISTILNITISRFEPHHEGHQVTEIQMDSTREDWTWMLYTFISAVNGAGFLVDYDSVSYDGIPAVDMYTNALASIRLQQIDKMKDELEEEEYEDDGSDPGDYYSSCGEFVPTVDGDSDSDPCTLAILEYMNRWPNVGYRTVLRELSDTIKYRMDQYDHRLDELDYCSN